ncbi:hypothetical protein V492_06773 [Pseudogymnoascus sp. VKM F-4246]|nr:hypothetical protein V492_06773 [Pseudogymnoascus sp. VKM F-4246]
MYTLNSIKAIVDGEIWDFSNFKFVPLDPLDQKNCQRLLIQYARRVLKVTYLTTHDCRQEDLESCLPLQTILQAFDIAGWEKKLKEIRSELHRGTLTTALSEKIIPKWQQIPGYPVQPGEGEDGKEERMRIWERFVLEDSEAMRWFVAPLWESVNFGEISCADNPGLATLDEWMKVCLVAAVEMAFSLQRDARDPITGKTKGGNHVAYIMNREWEAMPTREPWRSRLAGVLVPLNNNFGSGSRVPTTTMPSIVNVAQLLTPRKTSGGHRRTSSSSEKRKKEQEQRHKRRQSRSSGVAEKNILFMDEGEGETADE